MVVRKLGFALILSFGLCQWAFAQNWFHFFPFYYKPNVQMIIHAETPGTESAVRLRHALRRSALQKRIRLVQEITPHRHSPEVQEKRLTLFSNMFTAFNHLIESLYLAETVSDSRAALFSSVIQRKITYAEHLFTEVVLSYPKISPTLRHAFETLRMQPNVQASTAALEFSEALNFAIDNPDYELRNTRFGWTLENVAGKQFFLNMVFRSPKSDNPIRIRVNHPTLVTLASALLSEVATQYGKDDLRWESLAKQISGTLDWFSISEEITGRVLEVRNRSVAQMINAEIITALKHAPYKVHVIVAADHSEEILKHLEETVDSKRVRIALEHEKLAISDSLEAQTFSALCERLATK